MEPLEYAAKTDLERRSAAHASRQHFHFDGARRKIRRVAGGVLSREIQQPRQVARQCGRPDDAAIDESRATLFQAVCDALGAIGRDGVRIHIRALIGMPCNLLRDLLGEFRRTDADD